MYKVLVIGDVRVGKTTFVRRLVNNVYSENYKATVGVDFALKTLELDDGQSAKIQLWDIAGGERTASMTRVYYKGASACVLMFDITDKDSFHNCLKWKEDLDKKVFLPDEKPIPCLLFANKSDLASQRIVSDGDIKKFVKDNNFIGWQLCSVKENKGVNEGMKFLTTSMIQRCNNIASSNEDTGFAVEPQEEEPRRRCC